MDDDPGVGYLFAIAVAEPFDFRYITRGDYWDYRLIDGGRIQGDPYVRLTDLAARIAPDGDYDYDIAPYYVDRRYDYPALRLLRLPRLRQLRRVGSLPRLVHSLPGRRSATTRATTRIATAAATWSPTGRPIRARASCFATPTRRASRA